MEEWPAARRAAVVKEYFMLRGRKQKRVRYGSSPVFVEDSRRLLFKPDPQRLCVDMPDRHVS